MPPSLLKNRNRDDSPAWLAQFVVSMVTTVLGCAWLICVFLEMVPAALSRRHTISDAFGVHLWLFGIVLGVMCVALFKGREFSIFAELRQLDARGIMSYLGARRMDAESRDLHLQRAININSEIAVASQQPPAELYWLPGEMGINAFTAGAADDGSALCVTEGAVRYLKRDELQAVIAHEYGHIANGDVRINTLMVRWLGVLMPMGFAPRRSLYFPLLIALAGAGVASWIGGLFDSEQQYVALLFFLAAIVGLVAWLPTLAVRSAWRTGADLARRSHAGHSRERELEADARAVEFTRYPQSLAAALRKIGGLARGAVVGNEKTAMFSHMCVAPALPAEESGAYATHPSIAERLEQLGFPLTAEEREQLGTADPDIVSTYADDVNRELGILHALR